jgi:hypothetical protein
VAQTTRVGWRRSVRTVIAVSNTARMANSSTRRSQRGSGRWRRRREPPGDHLNGSRAASNERPRDLTNLRLFPVAWPQWEQHRGRPFWIATHFERENGPQSRHQGRPVRDIPLRVARWRTSDQKLRWCATVLCVIERQFRRIKNHRHLPPCSSRRFKGRARSRNPLRFHCGPPEFQLSAGRSRYAAAPLATQRAARTSLLLYSDAGSFISGR